MLEKTRSRSRLKKPYKTAAEFLHMQAVANLPCIVCNAFPPSTVHHCLNKIGKRKDHMKVIPLCPKHHLHGPESIDGKVISKPAWEAKYGTEEQLLEKVRKLLE